MASGLFLALFFACVSAMTPSNGVEFLFPTQGATLHYNDYVQVQYTSEFSAPFLYTFCRAASGSVSQKQSQGVGGYNSTALLKLSWTGSDTPCWFNLKPSAGAAVGKGANSDNWQFDVSERAATTVVLGSSATATATASPTITTTSSATTTTTSSDSSRETSSMTSTAASSSGSSTTSSAESTATSSDEPTSSSLALDTSASSQTASASAESSQASNAGLSMGAQIGVGIGVAIAGICFGVSAGIWCMRRRRQKARQGAFARIEAPPSSAGQVSSVEEMKYPPIYAGQMPHQIPLTEMPGAALAQCLQESECVMVQRNSAADCLRSPLAETLPTKCQQLKKGFGECRRGMIDMRKRFRGNQPAAFKNLQESEATGEGYQLYAGKSAFGGTRGETAGDGKAPPDWRDLENAKYRNEVESKKP
ncbi:cytochrome-1 [Diaporthe amygdali]|uniref:cytochrome-1 n=1 Tax=Phomopsis amygdali TaxID=1214568 RepID=UPI0022FF0E9A|nr:cytochrome-1 [Diaporthe amygdali]KAJ0123158.1 cytochrome-1 [Diaporthe amygdali]